MATKWRTQQQDKERKRSCAATAKGGYITTAKSVTHWKNTSKSIHHGTTPILSQLSQEKGETKNDGDWGLDITERAVISV